MSAAHDGMGLVYLIEQDYDKVIVHLTTALKLHPEINHALFNLDTAYLKKGNKREALFYFNKFKRSPSYPNLPLTQKSKLEMYIKECKDDS
jgi:tetratricopeptide (TPR) repeat protein